MAAGASTFEPEGAATAVLTGKPPRHPITATTKIRFLTKERRLLSRSLLWTDVVNAPVFSVAKDVQNVAMAGLLSLYSVYRNQIAIRGSSLHVTGSVVNGD